MHFLLFLLTKIPVGRGTSRWGVPRTFFQWKRKTNARSGRCIAQADGVPMAFRHFCLSFSFGASFLDCVPCPRLVGRLQPDTFVSGSYHRRGPSLGRGGLRLRGG